MSQPRSPKSDLSKHISWALHFSLAFFISLPLVRIQALSFALPAGRELQPNAGVTVAIQEDQQARQLEMGKPIERELAGGQSHSYQITLDADQYLHLVVEQRGIDVVVRLIGPDGKQLIEVDSPNGSQGPEPVLWIAKDAGAYRLEVRSLEQNAAAGRYEAKIVEL